MELSSTDQIDESDLPVKKLAPRALATLAIIGMLLWLGVVVYLAYMPPWMGLGFEPSQDGNKVIVKYVDPSGPAYNILKKGDQVKSISNTSGEINLVLSPDDIILEPDSVSRYETYNLFFENQNRWYDLLQQQSLRFVLSDGSEQIVSAKLHRPVNQLPWLFWFQVLCGVITFVAGVSVWATRGGDRILFYYGLTGLGLLLASSSAAIYSTRELALDATIFYRLSMINQFGSYLFSGPFLAILWNYPKPLGKPLFGNVLILFFLLFWLANVFQIPETLDVGMRYPLIAGLAILIVLSIWQWLVSPHDPLSRAIMNWFLMAWLLSGILYVGLVTIPLLFGLESFIDQSIAWGILLLVYLGVTAGILKYQLFNVEKWVVNFWLWILGGLLVVGIDAFLIIVLDFGNLLSLTTALALAGWIYFPVRQWLWQKFQQLAGKTNYRDFYTQATQLLFDFGSEHNVDEQWKIQLQAFFQPISIQEVDINQQNIVVEEQGMKLYVPLIKNELCLILIGAQNGRHLFNNDDVRFVNSLQELFNMAFKVEQAAQNGAIEERKRIARDLHDNVGAKLLSLIYRSEGRGTQDLARDSLKELRELIQGLEKKGDTPRWACRAPAAEPPRRCNEAKIILTWKENIGDNDFMLNTRQLLNLKAVFSELLSNVIKHAKANTLSINTDIITETDIESDMEVDIHPTYFLVITFSNNGNPFLIEDTSSGQGIHNIKQRIIEINGEIDWLSTKDNENNNINKSIVKIPLQGH